jgi:hypothetical protein
MERRNLLIGAPAAVIAGASLASAAQSSTMEQIDGSPSLVGVRGVSVSTASRADARSLVDAGTFDAEGYASLVLNLAGQLKGSDATGGEVGAMLIPDVAPFDRAYANMGLLPESIVISVRVSTQTTPYFMAKQKRADVGFPRYRVLLFNETQSPTGMSFFVYRSHSR